MLRIEEDLWMQQTLMIASDGLLLLMAMFMTPAHDAKLMVGHWKCDFLLEYASIIVVELLGDINATGDGTSGMDL